MACVLKCIKSSSNSDSTAVSPSPQATVGAKVAGGATGVAVSKQRQLQSVGVVAGKRRSR
jgi:hypothetical protein